MTKREQNAYYKSLHDMSIVKNEFSIRDKTIATQDKTIASLTKDNTALQNQIEQYKQRYGLLELAE